MPELAEKWPKDVVQMGHTVAPLSGAAAEHLGLTPGIPVAQGGADAFVAMVGLGTVRPGQLALITGSSHLHLGVTEGAFHGPGIWGTYSGALVGKDSHVVEGGQTSTGSGEFIFISTRATRLTSCFVHSRQLVQDVVRRRR
jgi:ribulose kinase